MGVVRDKLRGKGDELTAIFKRYGLTEVRVFGSVAKGKDTITSDIDLVGKCDFFEGSFSGKLLLRLLASDFGYLGSIDIIQQRCKAEIHKELSPIKGVDLYLVYIEKQVKRAVYNDNQTRQRIFDNAVSIEKFY